MTKKEFKKKCRKDRTKSYKLMLYGEIAVAIGFVIVAVTMFLIEAFLSQIIGFAIGGGFAFIGIILELMGEVILAKEYREYISE